MTPRPTPIYHITHVDDFASVAAKVAAELAGRNDAHIYPVSEPTGSPVATAIALSNTVRKSSGTSPAATREPMIPDLTNPVLADTSFLHNFFPQRSQSMLIEVFNLYAKAEERSGGYLLPSQYREERRDPTFAVH